MQRLRAFLITLIILAIAIHVAWIAVGPLLAPTVIGLVVISLLGRLYYRKGRW